MIPRRTSILLAILCACLLPLHPLFAGVQINEDLLGESLGGWLGRKKQYAKYEIANDEYRTFRPHSTPSPDGGLYISLRIDHLRGFLSPDDHAVLEMTTDGKGHIISTRSSVQMQGARVTTDLIAGGARDIGKTTTGITPAEMVVSLGTNLVANLTEKLGKETHVESGRVHFPSVVQHNFNLLYKAIYVADNPKPEVTLTLPVPVPATSKEAPHPDACPGAASATEAELPELESTESSNPAAKADPANPAEELPQVTAGGEGAPSVGP